MSNKWNFDIHCTQNIPETLSQRDFGFDNDDFAMTKPFQILTPEAIQISLDIIKNDEAVKKYCRFNNNSVTNRLKQGPNTYGESVNGEHYCQLQFFNNKHLIHINH